MALKRRWFSLLILASCLVLGRPDTSQAAVSASGPLILSMGGEHQFQNEFYAWTGPDKPLQNLTHYGWNGSPIISPNNRYIAYLSMPKQMKDELLKDDYAAGVLYPANIWILDLTTGQGTQIPVDAVCSEPVWSPDSKQIAWTEIPFDVTLADRQRLRVYDLTTKSTRVLVPHLEFLYPPYPNAILWGAPGIAVDNYDKDGKHIVQVYQPDGKLVFSMPVGELSSPFMWLKDADRDYLGLTGDYPDAITFIDVATQQQTTNQATLELYSLSAPGGISLIETWDSSHDHIWELQVPGQQPVLLTEATYGFEHVYEDVLYNVAISPDGRRVAYVKDDQLFIYQAGKTIPVPVNATGTIRGITWGAMGWRVHQASS